MRLLLDTHVFLWYITANPKLPLTFQAAIQDPTNEVYLSVVSVWAAVIKYHLNRRPHADQAFSSSLIFIPLRIWLIAR